MICFFFFFQAEDGIRDVAVTGVQTCALPIFPFRGRLLLVDTGVRRTLGAGAYNERTRECRAALERLRVEIGRASCRERVEISVVAVSLKKNNIIEIRLYLFN